MRVIFFQHCERCTQPILFFSRPYLVLSLLCDRLAPVCRLSVTLCIVAKRCVLEQKLLLTAYRKSSPI